jgi:hypothetical protein
MRDLGGDGETDVFDANGGALAVDMVCVGLGVEEDGLGVAVGKVEELDGDFGMVGGDLEGC